MLDEKLSCFAKNEDTEEEIYYKSIINQINNGMIEKSEIEKLADEIIKTGKVEYIYRFAKDVNGAPIDKLADAVIKIGVCSDIISFARDVKGAPIDKLADVIIKTGTVMDMYFFSIFVEDAPVDKFTDKVIEIGTLNQMIFFATSVPGVPLDNLTDAIIRIGDASDFYGIALIEGAPIDKLADAVIKKRKAVYIYMFARSVKEAPIDKLADAIIEIRNAEYIFEFAKNVEGAPIDKLANAIIETRDVKYIYHFAACVEGAPFDKLVNNIIEIIVSNNKEFPIIHLLLSLSLLEKEKFLNNLKICFNLSEQELALYSFNDDFDSKLNFSKKIILNKLINNRNNDEITKVKLQMYVNFLKGNDDYDDIIEIDEKYQEYLNSLEQEETKKLIKK